ncbi:hypothetical protein IAT38_003328 [Cryptococcus sp. DSM 104549]
MGSSSHSPPSPPVGSHTPPPLTLSEGPGAPLEVSPTPVATSDSVTDVAPATTTGAGPLPSGSLVPSASSSPSEMPPVSEPLSCEDVADATADAVTTGAASHAVTDAATGTVTNAVAGTGRGTGSDIGTVSGAALGASPVSAITGPDFSSKSPSLPPSASAPRSSNSISGLESAGAGALSAVRAVPASTPRSPSSLFSGPYTPTPVPSPTDKGAAPGLSLPSARATQPPKSASATPAVSPKLAGLGAAAAAHVQRTPNKDVVGSTGLPSPPPDEETLALGVIPGVDAPAVPVADAEAPALVAKLVGMAPTVGPGGSTVSLAPEAKPETLEAPRGSAAGKVIPEPAPSRSSSALLRSVLAAEMPSSPVGSWPSMDLTPAPYDSAKRYPLWSSPPKRVSSSGAPPTLPTKRLLWPRPEMPQEYMPSGPKRARKSLGVVRWRTTVTLSSAATEGNTASGGASEGVAGEENKDEVGVEMDEVEDEKLEEESFWRETGRYAYGGDAAARRLVKRSVREITKEQEQATVDTRSINTPNVNVPKLVDSPTSHTTVSTSGGASTPAVSSQPSATDSDTSTPLDIPLARPSTRSATPSPASSATATASVSAPATRASSSQASVMSTPRLPPPLTKLFPLAGMPSWLDVPDSIRRELYRGVQEEGRYSDLVSICISCSAVYAEAIQWLYEPGIELHRGNTARDETRQGEGDRATEACIFWGLGGAYHGGYHCGSQRRSDLLRHLLPASYARNIHVVLPPKAILLGAAKRVIIHDAYSLGALHAAMVRVYVYYPRSSTTLHPPYLQDPLRALLRAASSVALGDKLMLALGDRHLGKVRQNLEAILTKGVGKTGQGLRRLCFAFPSAYDPLSLGQVARILNALDLDVLSIHQPGGEAALEFKSKGLLQIYMGTAGDHGVCEEERRCGCVEAIAEMALRLFPSTMLQSAAPAVSFATPSSTYAFDADLQGTELKTCIPSSSALANWDVDLSATHCSPELDCVCGWGCAGGRAL